MSLVRKHWIQYLLEITDIPETCERSLTRFKATALLTEKHHWHISNQLLAPEFPGKFNFQIQVKPESDSVQTIFLYQGLSSAGISHAKVYVQISEKDSVTGVIVTTPGLVYLHHNLSVQEHTAYDSYIRIPWAA